MPARISRTMGFESNKEYNEIMFLREITHTVNMFNDMGISFVCLREDGCLELPATVKTACRTAARKVPELEGFHFHTLRHTYTTNLLSNGAQPKDVQKLLGHSDASTTMNVYAHATREAKRESAKLLDKVVGMN